MQHSYYLLIAFAFYLIIIFGLGIVAYFFTKNFSDYALGGRKLGSFVTAMSAGASDMSGWLLMGLPGALYLSGLVESWIAIGLTIGAWLNWKFVAPRLRVFTEFQYRAVTLPGYFYHRFSQYKKTLKLITAIIILFFFSIYSASGVVASGRLFETLFQISYYKAMILGTSLTIIYTFIGGFLAVSWSDAFQAFLMLFALILTPIMIYISINGNFEATMLQAEIESKISYTSFTNGATFIFILSAFAWGLGYFGQPHILTRFMAIDNVKSIPKARRIGITWMFLCLLGAVLVGYFGIGYFTYFKDRMSILNGNPEKIFIALSLELFNPWIAGIILSAILAAVMSTLSAQFLIVSSVFSDDVYRGFFRKQASDKEMILVSRIVIISISLLAMIIALNPDSKVLRLVSYAWAGFGACFGPAVIISLFWSRVSGRGIIAGMITGFLVVVLWYPLTESDIYEIIPGFILSSFVIVVVSLCNKIKPETINTFKEAETNYKTLSK